LARRSGSSLERGLRLLAVFATADEPELTVADLARQAGLPPSTAYRYIQGLREAGYLESAGGGALRLGEKVAALARRLQLRDPLPDLARPVMRELSRLTSETVLLVEAAGIFGVCVERVESQEPVRLSFAKGRMEPLHAGATVRALLAFLPDDVLDAVIAGGLSRYTEATITDPGRLRENLAEVRRLGYANSVGEMDDEVRALAVPLRPGGRGWARAALSVTGPAFRFTDEKVTRVLPLLQASAARIEGILGRLGDRPESGNI
jgi:DNA-binding IclR family transcriptional regulator